MLIEEGRRGRRAFVTDFGLTKSLTAESGVTDTGVLVGTIDYMAPEQFAGAPLDARTDVYALGAVYFAALSGEVPFPGSTPAEKMYGHTAREVPSLCERVPELPRSLDEVVQRALAKQPEDRFPSAGDLGRTARAAVEGQPTVAAEHSVATGAAASGLAATEMLPSTPASAADAPPPAGATPAPPPPPRAPAPTRALPPEPEPPDRRRNLLIGGCGRSRRGGCRRVPAGRLRG